MYYICLIAYYIFAQWLPSSFSRFGGSFSKKFRYVLCKHIFQYCGHNVNIERKAHFGNGKYIRIDDNSNIGINCVIPNNTVIGKYVMMGPNCLILPNNHIFDDIDTPMCLQGHTENLLTNIEDDCWIGTRVTMTPGRTIRKGSIIAAGCVLCKDFPPYSIVGGNPSKLIKSRNDNK